MLMDLYTTDRNNVDLIDEYMKRKDKGKTVFPEFDKYPFINELDTSLGEKGDKILTAWRYSSTLEADKTLKKLGITDYTDVSIDDKKLNVIDTFSGYTEACLYELYEGFLNGYLALLNIITGKRI